MSCESPLSRLEHWKTKWRDFAVCLRCSSEMLLQECQRSAARKLCRLGVLARSHVAIDTVPCALIPVYLHLGMCGMYLLHLFSRYVCIQFAEVQLNRDFWILCRKIPNAARIVAHRSIWREPRCTQPREQAAKAIANYA